MTLAFDARQRFGPFVYEAALEAREEILVLFGHSGAGKSLTLQMTAGLVRPASGRIVIDGRTVFDAGAKIDLPPQQRGVGYVVQDLALFRHMTVAENIAFGIPRGVDARRRTGELLALLGLEGFAERRPRTLSGGQQQRVALARALARDARLLLLDEPFSALDESLRAGLRRELLRLRAELGLTILFVTHDLREAHLLADRIAVFDAGRVLQFGAREEVFARPVSRRVGELTGVANILRGELLSADGEGCRVRVGGLELLARPSAALAGCPPGTPVDLMVRAERVILRRDAPPGASNVVAAELREEFAYGASHALHFVAPGAGLAFEVELASRPYDVLGVAHRKQWLLELPPGDLHVVPAR